MVTVHSLPSLPQPRLSRLESPWWKAREFCQDTDLASELQEVNPKARKPEEQLREGVASPTAKVSPPSSPHNVLILL